jgi:phage/plasmid primase-like uncharacterized protein
MEKPKRVDVTSVKLAAAGNWSLIFNQLLPDFDERLLERAGRKHGPCPLCGGKDRFQFYKDAGETGGSVCRQCGPKPDGFEMVAQAHSCNFIDSVRKVQDVLGGEVSVAKPASIRRHRPDPKKQEKQKRRDAWCRKMLKQVWRESLPAEADEAFPLRAYLANRGLPIKQYPKTLRFHRGLKSFDEDGNYEGTFPAMVALVVDKNGDPITIHRTFITGNGNKAPVESAKKLMAYPSDRELSGGAIHLSGTGRVLNVAEGIETAFAVQQMVGGSIWATVNASMMRNLEVGEPVEALWVWSDLDRSGDGQTAANELVDRVRNDGKRAVRELPPVPIPAGEKSVDWLDIYNDWYQGIAKDKGKLVRRMQLKVA